MNTKRGAMMMELVIAMGLLSTVFSLALPTYVAMYKLQARSHQRLERLQQANALLRRLRLDLQSARTASVATNQLTLTKPDGEVISFVHRPGGEVKRRASGRTTVVADAIPKLTFAQPTASLVRVTVGLFDRPRTVVETQVALRNATVVGRATVVVGRASCPTAR